MTVTLYLWDSSLIGNTPPSAARRHSVGLPGVKLNLETLAARCSKVQ